jgi:hypothetical protein
MEARYRRGGAGARLMHNYPIFPYQNRNLLLFGNVIFMGKTDSKDVHKIKMYTDAVLVNM